jgi:hypothetical protein
MNKISHSEREHAWRAQRKRSEGFLQADTGGNPSKLGDDLEKAASSLFSGNDRRTLSYPNPRDRAAVSLRPASWDLVLSQPDPSLRL